MVEKKADLRYGENPHQLGAFYADPAQFRTSISRARQIAGKDLSFNNLLDLDAAWAIASDFKTPAVTIVKHGNPCGLASVVDLAEAFRLALEGDSVSAYGGIIGANRVVDEAAARAIRPGFFEAIVAPGYTPEALEILRTKKGFEIIEVPRPTPMIRRWGSATSTSSASAAASWSRPSTTWRRTATSSRS